MYLGILLVPHIHYASMSHCKKVICFIRFQRKINEFVVQAIALIYQRKFM